MESPSSLGFRNQYQIFCGGLWACFCFQQLKFKFPLFLFAYFTALSNFLHNYDFAATLMQDFNTTKELHSR